jgi:inner membrane protein
MQRETVWLVEDEQGIADTLVYMLQQEGFAVEVFERGLPVLDKARQQAPDVMILDVGLPDISGFELCRQLLALHPALPVLFLTARSEEVDRLLGLEIGADDYVAKPFSPREVCARVRTLLRRVKKFSSPSPVIRIGHFELNEPAAQISWFDTPLTLTRYEFLLLKTLLKSPGRVWSRQQLMDSVWEDARGIGVVKAPEVNGTALTIEPGTGLEQGGQGVHIPLPEGDWRKQNLKLNMALNLSGTGDLSVVPAGRNSEMTLTSNWPHPSFLGDFLPAKREVSESGFQAQWQSSWFANNLGERFASGNDTGWENFPAFSVAVTTPADQYQLTDRATKYAILLIALTFMAFFVFETLTAQRLHPMQYLLVGLSLVMFYLLLLALSEHIGFTVAWIIASLIGALMNGIYLQAVLKGWRNSMLFTLALLLLDGVMWGLLNSADSALLLGTSVLVVALAGMMFVTRNIDWYAFSLPKMKASKEVTMDDQLRIWK